MLEAYRDFRHFRGGTEAEWLAWLRRILDAQRRQLHPPLAGDRQAPGPARGAAASRQTPPAWPGASPADQGESPSQQLLRKERELLVADAIAQLPPDYQEVICLRNLQRLPFQDVAERMGRSRPAVQMLWMRRLEKLQQILAATGRTPRRCCPGTRVIK